MQTMMKLTQEERRTLTVIRQSRDKKAAISVMKGIIDDVVSGMSEKDILEKWERAAKEAFSRGGN